MKAITQLVYALFAIVSLVIGAVTANGAPGDLYLAVPAAGAAWNLWSSGAPNMTTTTWTDGYGDWNTAANWDNGMPNRTTDAVINGTGHAVSLSADGSTTDLALARLDRGNIKLLQFAIRGTDSAAEGRVSFAYEGLKVSMLKKDSTQASYHKKGLVSLFANIVLKNSSPAEGSEPKEVHFQRILNKSIFNLMWKTLFMGVKKSAGIK